MVGTYQPGVPVEILSAAIIVFVVIETFNIGMLYFRPGSRLGNGVGVFNAYQKAEADLQTGELVRYLVNWVAGTKLIFVALLIVILVTGSDATKALAVVARSDASGAEEPVHPASASTELPA